LRVSAGRREAKKHIFDIQQAPRRLAEFTGGRGPDTYVAAAMLRSADLNRALVTTDSSTILFG